MADVPLHFKTITELAGLIQSGQVSPVEVTNAMLQRINQLDGKYKSYATLMADHALDSAKRAEQEITSGQYRGPLHGVPVSVKDLCCTSGVRRWKKPAMNRSRSQTPTSAERWRRGLHRPQSRERNVANRRRP